MARPATLKILSMLFGMLAGESVVAQSSNNHDRCRVTAEGQLICDEVERARFPHSKQVRDFFEGHSLDGIVRPTRLFAGPDLYPPEDYRGYGIIAFPSRATEYDGARHAMICAAYVASFPDTMEVTTPSRHQFVTIWPVVSDQVALEIASLVPAEACERAIDNYSMDASYRAISAAEKAGFRDDGLGPYLLAWSPPDGIGRTDVFVLALDLSNVRSYEQALAMMQEWYRDIETDYEILSGGFTLERLRLSIRRWADTYGDGFLRLIQAG